VGGQARKPVIGILGGIGSGKTTVAAELGRLGCAVIRADRIAHQVLERPDVRRRVVHLLGEAILDSNSRIDRKKVAAVVFADPGKVSAINQIVHPPVLDEVERLMRYYQQHSDVPALVLDIPLLLEVGWADRCDRLIFVACDLKTRAARAKDLTVEEILARENFQISLDKKAAAADNVVENNSDLSALVRQIATIFSSVMKNHGGLQSQGLP
jgi:dephospho-CoA kinase